MTNFADVAKQFTEFYYNQFDQDRKQLAPLYRDNSMLTFESTSVAGAAGIVDKLSSLHFTKVKHAVSTLDAQPSGEHGGILILVTGALLVDDEQRPMNYSQTFQLLPDGAGSYFIFNDIFKGQHQPQLATALAKVAKHLSDRHVLYLTARATPKELRPPHNQNFRYDLKSFTHPSSAPQNFRILSKPEHKLKLRGRIEAQSTSTFNKAKPSLSRKYDDRRGVRDAELQYLRTVDRRVVHILVLRPWNLASLPLRAPSSSSSSKSLFSSVSALPHRNSIPFMRRFTTNYMRAGIYLVMGIVQWLSLINSATSLIAAAVMLTLAASFYALAGIKGQGFVGSKTLGGQGVAQMII
ncbi:hypothetical protein G7Y89_g235 [Cudoniella acicularis]|uniref:Nuclear transport factor 2 n=1 Tax=Cudoniella acicularis TaxID=354080 RepID=A0A8H4RXI7_9HELO|nr:hypothetical protein G7Y89_g235 [Cudoniella acicularis]